MVDFLDPPFKDESIYSLVGRNKLKSLRSNPQIKLRLYGTNSMVLSNVYPVHLSSFVKNTVHLMGWDIEYLINNHTIWNYFFSFLEPTEVQHLRRAIDFGEGLTRVTFARFGEKNGALPKYCPLCKEESKEKSGEFYFNRYHQIPNYSICLIHKCFLEEIKIESYSGDRTDSIYPPSDELCPLTIGRPNPSQVIYSITKRLHAILDGDIKPNFNFISSLRERGLNNGAYSNITAIKQKFYQTYGENTRKFYDIGEAFVKSNLINGTRKNASLIGNVLLEKLIHDLPNVESQSKPGPSDLHFFGIGPWECLNPKCAHYGEKIIVQAKFRFYTDVNRTVGTFTCECGMTYSKSYLIEQKKVIKVFIRKNIKTRRDFGRERKPSRQERINRRKTFYKLHKSNLPWQELTNKKTVNRNWLLKFEPEWLKKQESKLQNIKNVNRRLKRNNRDLELLSRVKASFKKLKSESPNYRISKQVILDYSGGLYVVGYPKTENFLQENSESLAEFRTRRLRLIAKELKLKNNELTVTKLLASFHNTDVRNQLYSQAQELVNDFS